MIVLKQTMCNCAYTVTGKVAHGLGIWRYKVYADIRRGSLVRCGRRVFSFDRYIFRMKFPIGFTYRNLHGFALFPDDSTALVPCSG